MNKRLIGVAVVALLIAGSSLAVDASAATVLKASIPFDFAIGGTVFPAGDYQVEVRALGLAMPTGSALMIRNMDGAELQLVLTRRGAESGAPGDWLLFNRYGNSYFLAAVNSNSVLAEVNKSAREKELAVTRTAQTSGAASESRVLIAAEAK